MASSRVNPRSVIFSIDSFVICCGWPNPKVRLDEGCTAEDDDDDDSAAAAAGFEVVGLLRMLFFDPAG